MCMVGMVSSKQMAMGGDRTVLLQDHLTQGSLGGVIAVPGLKRALLAMAVRDLDGDALPGASGRESLDRQLEEMRRAPEPSRREQPLPDQVIRVELS